MINNCSCVDYIYTVVYSEGHKHVTDVKLDSTIMFVNRIMLLQGLLILEELTNFPGNILILESESRVFQSSPL